jgi:transcription-repair coupling factor (superfamily II helicase)
MRIASVRDEEGARDVVDELVDRWGEPPAPVLSLLEVALAKAAAEKAGIALVSEKEDGLILRWPRRVLVNPDKIAKLAASRRGRLMFSPASVPYFTLLPVSAKASPAERLREARALLEEIFHLKLTE